MTTMPSMRFRPFISCLALALLPATWLSAQSTGNKPPPLCAVSILALGQSNPTRFTSPQDYLAKYSGIDKQIDQDIRAMIASGAPAPVPIPEMPEERPPGPLMVLTDGKERKPLEFSLNLGGISRRVPALQGQNLDIYLAKNGPSSASPLEGGKRKIHSIPIAPGCTELLLFFIKPPTTSWKGYQVKPLDISKLPERSVQLVNFSRRPLLVRPDTGDPNPPPAQTLRPGGQLVYRPSDGVTSVRMIYSLPETPDKILCSVNCETIPNQRGIAYTFGLGTPENGVDVASRSLRLPIEPLPEARQDPQTTPPDEAAPGE